MSGGSMNYAYCKLDEVAYEVSDQEIKELLKDLSEVVHNEEWARSGDSSKKVYEKSLVEFKKKWFETDRSKRLKCYVDKTLEEFKEEMYSLIGVEQHG